jgi:hypothetical protein
MHPAHTHTFPHSQGFIVRLIPSYDRKSDSASFYRQWFVDSLKPVV